ncbi:hypothetical protein [Thermodesulfitimonas autotrophica]|uniref:hypothetical protein n=1 Tax=Thermodesulfitimonas autotrophica TaxID=1894989 RepID=UPI002FE40A8D
MTAQLNDTLWVLELRGTLLTPLMARNALKSNVTWSSYPFVPPTGASGFFADLLSEMKWYEVNNNRVRRLHELPDYCGVFALGGYPTHGRPSRRHFRAHIGSLTFNYEAYVWTTGRNEGKKLAVIEEYLTDELWFVVAARDPEPLCRLHQAVRGRMAKIAKKGWIQIEYTAEPRLTRFQRQVADGQEKPMVIVPLSEVGAFPLEVIPYRVPIRSEGTEKGIFWHVQDVIWFQRDVRFKPGTSIYADDQERGISASLLEILGS